MGVGHPLRVDNDSPLGLLTINGVGEAQIARFHLPLNLDAESTIPKLSCPEAEPSITLLVLGLVIAQAGHGVLSGRQSPLKSYFKALEPVREF